MLDDDTLEIGVKENKGKARKIIDWLFDFFLCFIITIGGIVCVEYVFKYPKIGIPALMISGVMAVIANL